MKKCLKLLLIVLIVLSASGCSVIDDLKPIKLQDTITCENTTIKTSLASCIITPPGFDLEELNKRDYKMSITVTYDVYYTKDWDVLFDIGYLGAPKYEVAIFDDDLIGEMDQNVQAPSSSKTRTITYTTNVVNLIDKKITLTFSSDNIQNKIHFKNIKVTYNCFK